MAAESIVVTLLALVPTYQEIPLRTSSIIKAALFLWIITAKGVTMIVLIYKEGFIGENITPIDMKELVPDASGVDSWKSIYFRDR